MTFPSPLLMKAISAGTKIPSVMIAVRDIAESMTKITDAGREFSRLAVFHRSLIMAMRQYSHRWPALSGRPQSHRENERLL